MWQTTIELALNNPKQTLFVLSIGWFFAMNDVLYAFTQNRPNEVDPVHGTPLGYTLRWALFCLVAWPGIVIYYMFEHPHDDRTYESIKHEEDTWHV